MHDQTKLFRHLLFVALTLAATSGTVSSRADEAPGALVAPAANQQPNQPPVSDGAQAMRNMVKSIGPEAAMDMMFSSINPVCQKTLLSKATDKAKAPANAEEMRDNKYLQPAIAVGDLTTQWAKGAPGNRNPAPAFNWMDPKNYWGWMRMDKPAVEPAQKAAPAVALPPRRY